VAQAESSPIEADDEATYEYNVPFGTGNRIDSGEVVEIMPQRLTVKVGESIRIVNDDIRDYMIGPFFVMAGQTLAMRFTHKGTIEGVCQINPRASSSSMCRMIVAAAAATSPRCGSHPP
jgi:hypothetical protein